VPLKTPILRRWTAILALALGACAGNVFNLEVGDCFDDGDLEVGSVSEVGDVPLVDCSQPHDNEVFAMGNIEGNAFPGDEVVAGRADEICLAEFEGFVGLDYATSALDFGWLVPTADSWAGGDRVVTCFVYRVDLGKVTGTLEGTGI
jgi:hypothetical protein